MDILNQSVGYFDKETGTNVVLVPGTVIPRALEKDDADFVNFLEKEKLLERAPRGFKPDAKQAYFYDKGSAVDADETDEDQEAEAKAKAEAEAKAKAEAEAKAKAEAEAEANAQGDDTPETTEDDADPDLFAVGAKALEEATVEEVEAMASTMGEGELNDLLALEEAGKNRKGVKQAIAKRRKEISGA